MRIQIMERKRGALAVFVCTVVLMWSTVSWAATPNDVAEERTEAVAEVLAEPDSPERTARLAQTIDDSLDFAYLASLALEEHWEERSDEERDEFMTLLRQLLQHNYEDRLGGQELDEDYTIEYEEGRIRGERAFVAAEVDYDERNESLVYRMYRDDDGDWTIYDLVIDDMSLEETYRDGYVPIIEDHGWGELINRMENRLEQLQEQ